MDNTKAMPQPWQKVSSHIKILASFQKGPLIQNATQPFTNASGDNSTSNTRSQIADTVRFVYFYDPETFMLPI